MDGWIKLWRNILDWEWYHDTNMVRLFIHFLLKANIEDKKWCGLTIKRGQFVTSLPTLNAETELSIQILRTCIAKLLNTGEINKQTTNKYTIITICKYEDYQQAPDGFQQTTNNQLTDNQQSTNNQLTTTKESKNIRRIGGDNARAREEIFSLLEEGAKATREQLCMSYGITEQQFGDLLRETAAEWETADEKDRTRKHLINCIRIKAQKLKTQKTNGTNQSRQAERERLISEVGTIIARREAQGGLDTEPLW